MEEEHVNTNDEKYIRTKVRKIYLKWTRLGIRGSGQTILDEIFKHSIPMMEESLVATFFNVSKVEKLVDDLLEEGYSAERFVHCVSPLLVLPDGGIAKRYPRLFSLFIDTRSEEQEIVKKFLSNAYPHSHMNEDLFKYGKYCIREGTSKVLSERGNVKNAIRGLADAKLDLDTKSAYLSWLLNSPETKEYLGSTEELVFSLQKLMNKSEGTFRDHISREIEALRV